MKSFKQRVCESFACCQILICLIRIMLPVFTKALLFSLMNERKCFQVPPAELEDLLRTHPLVSDVAVIGVPHDRLGNAPRAYVVVAKDNDLTVDQVRYLSVYTWTLCQ